MDVQGLGRTDRGLVRTNNEDHFIVDVDLGLYLVCDGMGGVVGGQVAAETATSTIERVVRDRQEVLSRVEHDPSQAPDLVRVVDDALRQACRDIYNRALSEPSLAGMGCTATCVLIVGTKAVMGHVGDTRLYLAREGRGHQLSTDHTLAADLVRQGLIALEALRTHPHRNVLTRVLGPQALVDVETLSFDLAAGDRLVICSDGLADHIPDEDWLAAQCGELTLEDLPDELIGFANSWGGSDNITVVAIGVDGTAPAEGQPDRSPKLVLDVVGSSFLFADLSLAQLSRVVDRCETRSYEPGSAICRSGDLLDRLLLVVSGRVRVAAVDGRSAVAGPGEHLGENFVLRPRRTRAAVEVEQRANVLALDQDGLLELAARRPWLGVALLTRLVQRMSSNLDRLTATEVDGEPTAADLL